MKRVTIDGETYACPFADIVRPLTPSEAAALDASVRRHGIISRIDWYFSPLHGRAIIDGVNRVEFGLRHGREIPLNPPRKVDDAAAKQLAIEAFTRRHLSGDELQSLRGQRIVRVVAARTEGKSFRTIGRQEGISHVQAQRDYDHAVSGGTPVPPAAPAPPEPAPPPPPKPTVTGTDGKTYPASPPRRKKARGTHLARAHRAADTLAKAVRAVLRGPHRSRLEAVAASAGVPLDGDGWPAVEGVRAVLRDLARPAASV